MTSTHACLVKDAEAIVKLYSNTKKTSKSRYTQGYLETRLETLESYWKAYRGNYEKLISSSKEKIEHLEEHYDNTEEAYMDLKTLCKDALLEIKKSATTQDTNNTADTNSVMSTQRKIKLAPITLNKFSGNYNNWLSFRDLFKTLVHDDKTLSNVEKHHYLRTSLVGEAESLVKHFAITDANYNQAWETLEQRYQNKRVIVNTILQRLMGQKKLSTENAKGIKDLLDTTKECLSSLSTLSINTKDWDPIIVHIVVSKLDIESHKQWEQSLGSSTEIPSFADLSAHLESRFRTLELIHPQQAKKETTSNNRNYNPNIKSFVTETEPSCTYCQQQHYICHCKKFATLEVPQRQEFVKNNNICFNCLIKGHSVSNCRQNTHCRKCSKRHHTLLHNTTPPKSVNTTNSNQEITETNTVSLKAEALNVCNTEVILATAQIMTKAKDGSIVRLRALIDQGSQASFVTETTAQLLNLKRSSLKGSVTGIGNDSVLRINSQITLEFQSMHDSSHTFTTDAYVLKKLTSLLPSHELSMKSWPAFDDLQLADAQFHKPSSIDVLLGADVHAQIITDGLRKHEALIAQNTKIGWLISGRATPYSPREHKVIVSHVKLDTDQLLRQFWELEEYSPHAKHWSPLESQCEEHFKKTHTRNIDGRYELHLPFKHDDPHMGDSRPLAVKRLLQMERRFHSKPEFKAEYSKFMQEYLSQGHMEPSPTHCNNKKPYYLPHHAVIRESSTTTKLRVVFDGSAKPTDGNSLNDELMIGPPLQQDIRNLIMRWRTHKICLVTDIKAMYRQILITKDDTNYQRILWRDSEHLPIQEFNLLTVSYGTSSAPYLAIRTLLQLADDEYQNFPDVAPILRDQVYMDDIMTGACTEEEAIVIQRRLTELLNLGGFPLHKWASNSEKVINQISQCSSVQNIVHIPFDNPIKTLGIVFNPEIDCFEIKIVLSTCNVYTKRSVLSCIATTFDPLGWLAPIVILLKIFMQKLWLAGLGWDEQLPYLYKTEWCNYLDKLSNMKPIQLPRWFDISSSSQVELHGFSDASTLAYAGVVFLRVINEGSVSLHLVIAKSKVAPVKQVTLPRLELCGAVLVANLLRDVQSTLKLDNSKVFAWTDSTIVLAWLRKNPNTWKTFVANRTSEILTIMNSSQWHHVSSSDNPADCPSRGVSPENLRELELWWKGPKFLHSLTYDVNPSSAIPETNLETKTNKIVTYLCTDTNDCFDLLSKFLSLQRLIRVTAYCLRFIKLCKERNRTTCNPSSVSYLTTAELEMALYKCVKLSQTAYFENEIALISANKPISKSSKLVTLNPMLDKNSILRVGGRLANSALPTNMKSPIIIMNSCSLATLIVRDCHVRTLHGGLQLTLSLTRRRYWVVGAKQLVKKTLKNCVICFKHRAKSTAPLMGNLPDYRVTPMRAFVKCSVDYAGPFTLKLYPGRCLKTNKAYICLFICTSTKAIHLELVSDLTSAAFLAAFKRFTARRGHCSDLYSDFGTNFVGASRELKLTFMNVKSSTVAEIAELIALDHTTWHFNPPSAPHFGGLHESNVKSVKGHLKRVIGQSCLTFEEFATLLSQVEACLNSRPLVLLDADLDTPPLTPGHFLIGESPITIPEENYVDSKLTPSERWKLIQKLLQTIWRRWQSEYLTTLQNRYKWSSKSKDIEIGTIVLVKDKRLPPGTWLLGRVIQKHPGSDGVTRVVTLQYKNNVFKRPVVKLCPLPIESNV